MRGLLVLVASLAAGAIAAQPSPRSGIDLADLDRTVRPQDDLYRFANGGWLDRTEIPPERVSWGTFAELADRAEHDVRRIVEGLGGKGGAARQVHDLYTSIVDETHIERLGAEPLRPQLERIDAIATTGDLAAEMGRLSATGTAGPFAAAAGLASNGGGVIVTVSQGGTLLPGREYYVDQTAEAIATRQAYQRYLVTIFSLAGRADPNGDAAAVIGLETVLAGYQDPLSSAGVRAASRPMTLRQLAAEMPGFDWRAWAQPQGFDTAGAIVLTHPAFFRGFAAEVRRTPLRTWKALLAARYITAASIYVSRSFADARFDFFGRVLTGQEAPRERWRRGVSLVNGYLGDAVGRLYVERHLPREARQRVTTLVRRITEAFRQALDESEWMTPETRRRARAKLDALRARVGHPERWRDYAGLRIRPDDLLGNVERAQKFENDVRMARLRGDTGGEFWLVPVQTVNGYYTPSLNEITLPAAVLQPPMFDASVEDAVNYGGIGALIGHEIGHAFDGRGRQIDAFGRIGDWWTSGDEQAYLARAVRLVEQYDSYSPLPGRHVDGRLTLEENVGDLGGIAVALRAYRISLEGRAPPVIDGFTGEQRLLIRWAQAWRAKNRDDYLRQTLLLSRHAPPQYRANGTVIHLDAFHAAFAVRPGDRLHLEGKNRVRIW